MSGIVEDRGFHQDSKFHFDTFQAHEARLLVVHDPVSRFTFRQSETY